MAIRSAMALTLPLDSLLPVWPGPLLMVLLACRLVLTLPRVNSLAGALPWRNPLRSGNAVRPLVDAFPGRVADEDADGQHDHARDDHCGHPGQPRKRPLAGFAQGRGRLGYRRAHGALLLVGRYPGLGEGGDEDRLDRVQAVLGLVEHDAGW